MSILPLLDAWIKEVLQEESYEDYLASVFVEVVEDDVTVGFFCVDDGEDFY